jgi:hypothetical protein
MTNHSLRSLAISLGALALVAGPAWSARVVEVRVGNHPTFTRVVFELDAKAGYEIERREAEGGGQELVVTLSAASEPRKVGSRSVMVAGVEVEPSGRDAVARVRLRQRAGLVKELILASPPRIVLDLMLPDDLARAEAPKPKPAPATPPKLEEPSERAAAPKPIEKADAAPPEPEKAAPPVSSAHAKPAPPAPPPVPATDARVESALSGERVVAPKAVPPDGAGDAAAAEDETETAEDEGWLPEPDTVEAAPEPVAKPAPPVARAPEAAAPKPMAKTPAPPAPAAAKPGLADRFGLRLQGPGSWRTYGLVGGGALIFAFVVALLLRRRSRTSLDALEMAREPLEGGDAFATGSGSGMGMGAERDSFPAAAQGLFDDESEKGDMDMAAQLPIERETRGRMQTPSGGADSDPGPLVRELERRMTQLESRLDQATGARARLERQVTAQSEELRVQRAAIARTQRALRGMNRGGDEATEPALRDPSKPPTGRV